jgi:hypothetical protein
MLSVAAVLYYAVAQERASLYAMDHDAVRKRPHREAPIVWVHRDLGEPHPLRLPSVRIEPRDLDLESGLQVDVGKQG